MKRNLKPLSRHPAVGTWSCAPQFMAKYDNREDQRISQTHRTATHDSPWSFLLLIILLLGIREKVNTGELFSLL